MARARRLFLIGYDGMNPLLLRRFIGEGCLPTFKALLARGSLNRVLPTIPAWTPTNWSSMVTGAPSGGTRLGGWSVRPKSASWDAPRTMSWEHAALGGAETLWEVADQAGLRTLITHYPAGSWGLPLKHGCVVAPGFHDAPFSYAMGMRYFATVGRDVRTRVDAPGAVQSERNTAVEEEGAPPGSSVVRLEPATAAGWRNAGAADLGAPLAIVLKGGKTTDYLHLLVRRGPAGSFERMTVCAEPDAATVLVEVPAQGWSDFAQIRVGPDRREAATRFRILAANAGAGHLLLVRSVVYGTRGFAWPAGLDEEILEACGPYYDFAAVSPVADDDHLAVWLDELRYMGEWQAKVARHVQETRGWDIHFSHWHAFDIINHPTVNGIDRNGPDYDPKRGEWLLEAQRKTYQLSDQILARFLELEQEGDLVCVASDHAMAPSHRYASLADRLREVGLLALGPDRRIDWSRTRAYLVPDRGAELNVNLAGREPMGIVPPDQRERVQEQIIDALLDWRDPVTGRRPIALALKLQDAQIIGYWGEVSGDVVVVMNRGYGWGTNWAKPDESVSVGWANTALHGSQIPTSEVLPDLSNMAALLLSGPGVKVGYERDWQRWGLMRMVDLAPTFASLLGLRTPRNSTGAVLSDLLEE